MKLSFEKLFYILASLIAATVILVYAKGILIPSFFALLFAFILYPVVSWLRGKNVGSVISIIISMMGVAVLFSAIIFLFSAQIVKMTDDFSGFQQELRRTFETSVTFINEEVNFIPTIKIETLSAGITNLFENTGFSFVSNTLGFTSTFLSYLTLSIVFAFLLLLYSKQLTRAMSEFCIKENRDDFMEMLKKVQKVGQQYLTGMVVLVLILGILNSIGLLILGIDYAIFFGFLAALLAVVPYVGSFVGGLIPTLYAFFSYDSYLYPLGVIGVFWVIQFLEGNFLNPKIVGGSLHVNALFSILALIGGGLLWGIPGMILFLPLMAMIRIISSYYEELKPLALLIGDDNSENKESKTFSQVMSFFKRNVG